MEQNGTALGSQLSNDGEPAILTAAPYVASVTVEGTSPLLFHRWSNEAVEAKSKAAKGSEAKKSDDVESYVYRDEQGVICLPGIYLRGSLCDPKNGAAKYRQDPRSPRKSALDLYKAGVVPLTVYAPITTAAGIPAETWDYLDSQRVMVQRNGVTRTRPAFLTGWRAQIDLQVLTPEYIPPADLLAALNDAGRLVGVGDFRPTYGRFQVVSFDVGLG